MSGWVIKKYLGAIIIIFGLKKLDFGVPFK
jgi:hypothetical protein